MSLCTKNEYFIKIYRVDSSYKFNQIMSHSYIAQFYIYHLQKYAGVLYWLQR